MLDAVIVGGGIAGLSAAYELSKRGKRFVVLDAAPRAGGVILSEQIDGFTIDAGPDALLIQKPDAIRLCDELGIGDRLVVTKPPRIAYIQRGGRLHPLPAGSVLGIPTTVGPFLRTSLFSWPGKLRMGAEIFIPPRAGDEDESIGSFMTRRFGREATEYLAEPLLAGIHAGDVDRLSLKALFPRFLDAERKHGSLIKAFRAQSPSPQPRAPSPSDGAFKSLPGGLSELVNALLRAFSAEQVRVKTAATALEGRGPFTVRTSTGESFDARAVVLATPSYVAANLVRERDPELADHCAETPYASVATVAIAYAEDSVGRRLDGSGFVVPRAEATGILAGSWLSSKWPHRAPQGRVLMRTFIGGARDPRALERDDRELIAQSLAALRPLMALRGDPLFTRVYRWTRANAQHEVGHLSRVAAIDRRLQQHPGLFVTGSGFRGVGIPDCVADGRKTAADAARWLSKSSDPSAF